MDASGVPQAVRGSLSVLLWGERDQPHGSLIDFEDIERWSEDVSARTTSSRACRCTTCRSAGFAPKKTCGCGPTRWSRCGWACTGRAPSRRLRPCCCEILARFAISSSSTRGAANTGATYQPRLGGESGCLWRRAARGCRKNHTSALPVGVFLLATAFRLTSLFRRGALWGVSVLLRRFRVATVRFLIVSRLAN